MTFRRAALAGFACGLALVSQAPAFAATAVPLEDPAFTDAITEQFRTALPDEHVIVVAPQRLTIGNAGAAVNLGKLSQLCHADPAGCDVLAANFVAGTTKAFVELNKPPERSQVRVAIRSTAVADAYLAHSRATGLNLQVQPFADGLVSTVVIDTPRAVRWASSKDLDALKLDSAGLLDLARANTHASQQPLGGVAVPAPKGKIGKIDGDDAYTASRVLFPADWAPLAKAQGGVLIVSLPRPGTIAYISDDGDVSIAALHAFTQDVMHGAPDALSDTLLRWTPDGWKPVP